MHSTVNVAGGRRKLVICALWTEVCMAFTALDALREGYEVYPVVDAIGGTSLEAHRAGVDEIVLNDRLRKEQPRNGHAR